MAASDNELRRVRGRVKWFDQNKGFGFIVADQGGPDILLHANVLRNFGQSSVCDDAGIEVTVQQTERGLQSVSVICIDPPAEPEGVGAVDAAVAGDHEHLPLEPARVKWFDKTKGFGFCNVFGAPADVFVHMEVLRRSGFSDLQAGEAIGVRVVDGERGRMAVMIAAWDRAIGEGS